MRPSVGLAVASADEPGMSADALLKQADVAMYSAKRSESSGVHSFTPDMYLVDPGEIDTARATNGGAGALAVTLLGQLRHAIDHGGLSLVYQPKFDLRTRSSLVSKRWFAGPTPSGACSARTTSCPWSANTA